MRAPHGDPRPAEHQQEPGQQMHPPQHGSHAHRLEGAVADAEAHEIAVRAVSQQRVAVLGHGPQRVWGGGVAGGGGGREGREGLVAQRGRDVEFFGAVGVQEEGGDGG